MSSERLCQVENLIELSKTLQLCGFQLQTLKLSQYDSENRKAFFTLKIEKNLQNGLGTLYGGVVGLIYEEASNYLCILEDKRSRLGITIGVDNNFCRPIPLGSEIIIESKVINKRNNVMVIQHTIYSKENKKMCGYGNVAKVFSENCLSVEKIIEKLKTNSTIQGSPYLHHEKKNSGDIEFSSDFYKEVTTRTDLSEEEKVKLNIIVWWTRRWKLVEITETFSGSLSCKSMELIKADANEQVLIVKVPLHSWLQNKTGGLNAGGLFGLVDEITSFVRLLSDIQNRRAVSAYIELKQIDSGIHLLEGSNLILSAKCRKSGDRLFFLDMEFISEESGRVIAVGNHIMAPLEVTITSTLKSSL